MKTKSILAITATVVLGTFAQASTSSAESVNAVLRFKEKVSMEDLAKSVTDPSSPRYQNFFSPEEIRQIAGPSDVEYQYALKQLKAAGVEVVRESPTHLFVSVKGERDTLASLQGQVSAPMAAFGFSPYSSIDSVNGLQASQPRRPHLVFADAANEDVSSPDAAKKKPKAPKGMQPADIHKLYGFDAIYAAGITGAGQDIAIATYDGFYIQDVKDYYTQNNLSPGPNIDQVTFNGTPKFDQGSAAETQTDAEFSGMIAPGANIHVFASADNSDAGELAMFTAILDDGRAKIVNYSWGQCEAQVTPAHKTDMDKVFARAVAQGVNIMVASGDSGSDCEQNGTVAADYPASNPNIVAVGGTTLSDNGSGLAAEKAWSGSGGGISKDYAKPDYQSALTGQFNMRSYPDVAFNADPASGQPTWVHYNPNSSKPPKKAAYVVIGGTSIAAPQWSGFLALVGEARAKANAKAIGFLNPSLYSIKNNASYLNDVTSGSNGAYSANAGWDAVTGNGSMKASALLDYLSK